MVREARRSFRLNSLSLEELNFMLAQLGDRLDELEGRRGTPKFRSSVDMGLNRVTQMQSGSLATDGATVVQVDNVVASVDNLGAATGGVQNLSASATPGANRLVMSPTSSQYLDKGWIPAEPSIQSNVTASRSLGTVYQNTTGKTMLITVSAYSTAAGAGYFAETDGSNPPAARVLRHDVPANYYQSIFFIVLSGNYYKVDFISGTTTLGFWTEWY